MPDLPYLIVMDNRDVGMIHRCTDILCIVIGLVNLKIDSHKVADDDYKKEDKTMLTLPILFK